MAITKNNFRILLTLPLLFFIAACGTLKEDRVYSKDGFTVNFPRLLSIESDLEDYQIDHPVKLSLKMVQNHLLSLLYREMNPPGKPRAIFTTKEAARLSPLFKRAMKKMDSDTYLHFQYQSSKGLTEGGVFATVDKIHWRFSRVHGAIYSSDILNREPSWKLVRMQGQTFHKEATAFVKITRRNWVLANHKMPTPKRRPTISTSNQTSP